VRSPEKAKLAILKREIAAGIADLENGRFRTYTDENLKQLADEICQRGRMRLNKLRRKARRRQ